MLLEVGGGGQSLLDKVDPKGPVVGKWGGGFFTTNLIHTPHPENASLWGHLEQKTLLAPSEYLCDTWSVFYLLSIWASS